MEAILTFFNNYLLLFIIGLIITILALIGYIIDNGFRGKKLIKTVVVAKPTEEIDKLEEIKSTISASGKQSLDQLVQDNKSDVLQELSQAANTNTPTSTNNQPDQQVQVVNTLDLTPQQPLNQQQAETLQTEELYDQPLMMDNSQESTFQIK